MKTSDFDFHLPEHLIAQHPQGKRDTSRLLVLNKNSGKTEHKHFYDILDFLTKDDVIVLNNTKVIPARLKGIKSGTNAKIEILLLKEIEKDIWEVICKPAKRVKTGTVIKVSEDLKATCIKELPDGIRLFKMEYEGILLEILERVGLVPLPPYIKESLSDNNAYQTVYAKYSGSAAAPTAGLHFTDELLFRIREKGVEVLEITLHVGLGTFRPVTEENLKKHEMHHETYEISSDTAEKLNLAKRLRKRIIAIGTTTVRTLESNYDNGFKDGIFDTNIFIYPGYKFKVIDAIITNFHLPKSTLIMLISAFTTKEMILNAYNEAINHEYRFFSFGDSMFIS